MAENNTLGARLKTFQVRHLPESSSKRAIIPASGSGVGFVTRFNPEWAPILDKETFEHQMKEVRVFDQVNHICYKVYNDKKAEALKSIPTFIHNQLKTALLLISLSLFAILVFSYIDAFYNSPMWQTVTFYTICGLATVF